MKRIALLIVFSLVGFSAFSQLDFGLKGGLNLTNISADMITDDFRIKSNPASEMGYHFGAFMRASLFGIFIQPELVFTSVASEYTITDLATQAEKLAKQRIGRVDLPVLIGVKLGSIRLGLGPVASVLVSDKSDLTDVTGYETALKSATVGYQLGGGFDFWKMGFDIRYEGGFSSIGEYIVVGGEQINLDNRAKQIILSLSYRF